MRTFLRRGEHFLLELLLCSVRPIVVEFFPARVHWAHSIFLFSKVIAGYVPSRVEAAAVVADIGGTPSAHDVIAFVVVLDERGPAARAFPDNDA
jgi:hypothetical protein